MHKSIALDVIDANPFRHMDRYPISESNIAVLVGSMDRTGFWENVVGRKVGSRYQLAYGHHRWIAFQRKYGKRAEMPLIVKDLSDEDMLRIMADENVDDFDSNAEVEQETIRAVVVAYAEGKIKLEAPDTRNGKGIRYAPGYEVCKKQIGHTDLFPYTAETIGKFLGWMEPNGRVRESVRTALLALEAIEKRIVDEKDMNGLSRNQAHTIAEEAKKIETSYVSSAQHNGESVEEAREKGIKAARHAAKTVAKKMRAEKDSVGKGKNYGVRDAENEMKAVRRKDKPDLPDFDTFIFDLSRDLRTLLGKESQRWIKFQEVLKFKDQMTKTQTTNLLVALRRHAADVQKIIDCLDNSRLTLVS